jgi:cell division septal protein FtsQ
MKIVSSGRVINSAEFYKKKKRRRWIQSVLISIGILVTLSSLIYFSRREQFLITTVTIMGENVVGEEEIIQTVKSLIDGFYFWVIPRANAFVYPWRVIKQNLIEEFPRLQSVDLNLNKFQTLVINIEERIPFALYCIEDKCFFMDKEGFIFALAPSFSDGVYFVYRTDEPIADPIGQRFVTPEEFEMLSTFIETLPESNIRPVTLKINGDDYNLFLPNDGQIIWRRGSDMLLLRSNLKAFLFDDAIKTQSDFLDKLLYLDLRTENKIFYKFKE